MLKTKLRDKTLKLLQNRTNDVTLSSISEQTKLDINWLKSFAKGTVTHPSVCRIETLYEYLSGKKLTL